MAGGRIGPSANVTQIVSSPNHELATTLNHLVVENGVRDIIDGMAYLARVVIVTVGLTLFRCCFSLIYANFVNLEK